MKLTDLDPRWYSVADNSAPMGADGYRRRVAGLSFDCPHCRETRLAVAIHSVGANHDPEPDNPNTIAAGEHVWAMAGMAFDDLSLTPSIDASKTGHWHGFITNGEIR